MSAISIIGAQWGDEGKGKVTALLANSADAVVRYHGGNNAGHTLYHNGQKFASHLVPSGVFNRKAKLYIGRGTVLDLAVLNKEIDDLKKLDVDLKGRLSISPGCHIIMPYHKLLDQLMEEAKGEDSTGTTRRGIGPVYADKVSYNGIRLFNLNDGKGLVKKLATQLRVKNKIIKALGGEELDPTEVYGALLDEYATLREFVRESTDEIVLMIKDGKTVLFEGAHGVLLDNDWGTYPYVSASSVVSGNINGGAGVPLSLVDRVIGVTKAYQTRVGNGPFPTELTDATGDRMREVGAERGTTTGRNRRCGWLDLVLLDYAVRVAGIRELAVTKLDVLDDFDELNVCVAYADKDEKISRAYDPTTLDAPDLSEKVRLIYKTLPGWKSSTRGVRKYEDLPQNAKTYLEEIERFARVPISMVSVGPNDEETIML